MQLLILSLLVAVASATYPSYYSGYGGYGSALYGHSYVLGDHGSDYAYSHAPSYSYIHSKPAAVSYVSKPAVHHVAAAPAVSYVSKPAVHHVAAAPAVSYVAAKPAVTYVQKPAVTYVQKPAVTYVQKPAVTYVQKPAVQYVAAAPRVEKYVAAAPAVSTYVAPAARVEKYVAPAVSYAVAAPKTTYVASAPATYSYAAPAAAVSYAAPAAAVSYAAPAAVSYSTPIATAASVISNGFSKINILSSSGVATKTSFPTESGTESKKFATAKTDMKENIPILSKEVPKHETESLLPSDVDGVDITSLNDDKVTENSNEKKPSIVGTITKKPSKVETNQENSRSSIYAKDIFTSTKKGSSSQTHRFPKDESVHSSNTQDEEATSMDNSHKPVNEFVSTTSDEPTLDISEKLTLPETTENHDSTSENRFVPIPDQDYENFGSEMSEPENIKGTYKKQSNAEFIKSGKSSAAQFFLDTIPIISRSPRKTSTFESSSLSSLVSSSDISSFEMVDIPLPYYYHKRNQRGELYQHEPTLEYIPNIGNF